MKISKAPLLCLLLLLPGLLAAETRYVTDIAKITLRTGESTSHRIIRMLTSGTSLMVLSDSKKTGYSKVKTDNGQVGYILTNQLMNETSARSRLSALQQEIDELKAAPGELRKALTDLQKQHGDLQTAHQELQAIKQKQEQELQSIQRTASNAIRISNERNELRQQVASLTRTVADLKQENQDLGNEATRDWFLIGAGVIIAGILIGLILPHLRFQRRRNTWGSL
ncbi:MAG: TIGR04211 family SH3 domain-containing protein [Pseudomonadota bacterium]